MNDPERTRKHNLRILRLYAINLLRCTDFNLENKTSSNNKLRDILKEFSLDMTSNKQLDFVELVNKLCDKSFEGNNTLFTLRDMNILINITTWFEENTNRSVHMSR